MERDERDEREALEAAKREAIEQIDAIADDSAKARAAKRIVERLDPTQRRTSRRGCD